MMGYHAVPVTGGSARKARQTQATRLAAPACGLALAVAPALVGVGVAGATARPGRVAKAGEIRTDHTTRLPKARGARGALFSAQPVDVASRPPHKESSGGAFLQDGTRTAFTRS